ncbi:radical SAM family uncharacterized protein [Klenkia soli]|uniref:Radical SAM family uncharacterized protein n=1 Tax=Klenkia soli TaxID=1052260 RepID=A0A1H0KN61_9ACTN|nr:TIGR03960 family B12-binding radical SAM protein [Klenkia soli]SDO57407.1 radical SAM family uncharacterized protein [Klenkia soli]
MTVESLYPRLEPLLAQVQKPIQYVGGELNAQTKPWDAVRVHWALMYPDAYEVGLPNQGLMILYEVLNERADALAERTYAVWPDLAGLMREHGVGQFTLENHRPVRDFDFLGVSFATELGYTNLLDALDLAGVPLHAVDRDETHPVVVAGGHAAFNPEPVADFVDCAVLGDGEQVVGDMTDVHSAWTAEGRPGGRTELLARLSRVEGVYVPQFYAVSYAADGTIASFTPNRDDVPTRVAKRTVMDLDEWPYPKQPLVPLAESVHERMSVEIFRGCTRGCRFCQAGMITRPVRERTITGIGSMVDAGLRATGYEEVGLLSLSSADHSEIGQVAKELADRYEGTNTGLSLPSTRVDAFNVTLANELSRNGRRSGLTFAPEGGSERIRRVINKTVSKEDLVRTVTTAYANGWRQVKLYFMCGLPTETDEDVLEIAELAVEVIRAGREAAGSKDIRCTVSIGGFVPKPHTPFQWAAQASAETIDHRLRVLRDAINADRRIGRSIGLRYHDGKPGVIEGLLSRGDRRVGRVIERVWRDGGHFDGWSEHFSYDRWATAAAEELAPFGVDLAWYTTRERGEHEQLPWDHLESGLDKEWLWDDWQEALNEDEVADCRWTPCYDCGVCPTMGTEIQIGPTGRSLIPLAVVGAGRPQDPAVGGGPQVDVAVDAAVADPVHTH